MGDMVANMAYLSLIMMAKAMPGKITNIIRMFKLIDEESIDKVEELIEKIVEIMESG